MEKVVAVVLTVTVMVLSLAAPAMAWSGTSAPVYYPGGDYLTADMWLGVGIYSFGFASSSYLHGYNPPYATWIKNTVTISADGWGVSLYGLSAGAGTSTISASWTNTYAYWSGLSGKITSDSALWWRITGTSTATAYAAGTVRLTSVTVSKYF